MRRLRCLQEKQITSLKTELAKGQPVSTLTRFSLPSEEAHSGRPSGNQQYMGKSSIP